MATYYGFEELRAALAFQLTEDGVFRHWIRFSLNRTGSSDNTVTNCGLRVLLNFQCRADDDANVNSAINANLKVTFLSSNLDGTRTPVVVTESGWIFLIKASKWTLESFVLSLATTNAQLKVTLHMLYVLVYAHSQIRVDGVTLLCPGARSNLN